MKKPDRPSRTLRGRLAEVLATHPVASVLVVAAFARIVVAFVSFFLNSSHLIPDEIQYVQLSGTVASGESAERWVPFYGQSLYNSTRAFSAPLTLLFRVFGVSRIWGQLLAAAAGTVAAGLTARLALEFVRPRLATLAGLVVALLPSQVLWSSVVLRESMVWSALVLVGLGLVLAAKPDRRNFLVGICLVTIGLLGLGSLRQQTLVAAAWAAAIAAPFIGRRWRLIRSVTVLALTMLVPVVAGIGLAGTSLVRQSTSSLDATRTYMAMDAESAFTPTTLLNPGGQPGGSGDTGRTHPGTGALGIAGRPQQQQGGRQVITSKSGKAYVTENNLGQNIKDFFPGVIAVAFRPFPWEHTPGIASRVAAVEDLMWYALYVIGILGLVLAWRHPATVAFPFLVIGNVIGIGALTQGNLGTAFRHRGQLAWAVAILAAVAVEELLVRRKVGRGATDEVVAETPEHRVNTTASLR